MGITTLGSVSHQTDIEVNDQLQDSFGQKSNSTYDVGIDAYVASKSANWAYLKMPLHNGTEQFWSSDQDITFIDSSDSDDDRRMDGEARIIMAENGGSGFSGQIDADFYNDTITVGSGWSANETKSSAWSTSAPSHVRIYTASGSDTTHFKIWLQVRMRNGASATADYNVTGVTKS